MGLDNGIIIKCGSQEKAQSIIDDAVTHLNSLSLVHGEKDVQVCYWRKCWNIRNKIVALLHMNNNETRCNIDLEDIKPIVKILAAFLDKETWDADDYGSIWEHDEFKENLFWQIMNLTWLYHYKYEHPEIEIEFYDSY